MLVCFSKSIDPWRQDCAMGISLYDVTKSKYLALCVTNFDWLLARGLESLSIKQPFGYYKILMNSEKSALCH